MESTKFKWNRISMVPAVAGVYAWYLPLKISARDIEIVLSEVEKCKINNNDLLAKKIIRTFIETKILNFYNEEPYSAIIEGPLKPKYFGKLQHEAKVSDSLVERLYTDPSRIEKVGNILIQTAPNFASPIYIGMASNLRARLQKHKTLMEKYSAKSILSSELQNLCQEEKRDHNFAQRVISRGIPETEMFVYIQQVSDEDDIYKDVENLLNRINYPVLGRN